MSEIKRWTVFKKLLSLGIKKKYPGIRVTNNNGLAHFIKDIFKPFHF
jgi:hypothetical protein